MRQVLFDVCLEVRGGVKLPNKIYAYAGKVLRVDLSKRRITTEATKTYASRFLGGRGINQCILYRESEKGISPFDPATRLIFGTGVLLGTPVPGACRYSVDSKNVFTGGVGSGNSGGHFGPELKFAGYDHVVIQGRSRRPCYLWIDDGNVEIKDARHLWGQTTWETEDGIRQELKDEDIQIASIGPAGENLVRAACIINNGARAIGRCGLGAVMGSKNLKAVAVRGSQSIEVANSQEFMKLIEELLERLMNNSAVKNLMLWGTTFHAEKNNELSGNPVRNFQDGYWEPERAQKIGSEMLMKEYAVRRLACFACPVACSHYLKVSKGKFKGTKGEGFETDTLKDFGYKLDIDYLPAIIKAHILCSQYGLDVDNTAGVIAWAFECYEKGILTNRDTQGLELDWGNFESALELIRKMALREGIGDLLAEGSVIASKRIGKGSERYSMNIKGQELYEPLRTLGIGWALGVIVSPLGGGHLRGAPLTERMSISPQEGEKFFGVPTAGNRKTYEGKAKLVVYFENFKAVVDSLGICYNLTQWSSPYLPGPKELAKLFSAATGWRITAKEMLEMGERIHNIEKAFNVREGMTRKDDWPPERFFEPVKSGPGSGEHLDKEKLEKLLDEYYMLRGWNPETGIPTKLKLKELGLKEVGSCTHRDSSQCQ
jgi:aldehyde:ferredoxin oxidoreductase